jgi:hypothetical protein
MFRGDGVGRADGAQCNPAKDSHLSAIRRDGWQACARSKAAR